MTDPQEPSATPSTLADLEKLILGLVGQQAMADDWWEPEWARLKAALRPSEGPPKTSTQLAVLALCGSVETLSAVNGAGIPIEISRSVGTTAVVSGPPPSEGPETGRPPADSAVLRDLETRIFYAETSLKSLVDSARLWKSLAALPAGPETGDRERLIVALERMLASAWPSPVNHPAMFSAWEFAKTTLDSVRQAAPAAAPAPPAPDKTYLKNNYICARKGDPPLFYQSAEHGIQAALDRYAIVPREDYDELVQRAAPAPAQAEGWQPKLQAIIERMRKYANRDDNGYVIDTWADEIVDLLPPSAPDAETTK